MCGSRLKTVSVGNPYLAQITSILSQTLQGRECQVYLFGSRATGDYIETSDFDVAVLASGSISKELSVAREMLELSNIPFTVDLIDLNIAPKGLVRQVQERGILIWKN
jgi:predicted nucleotidyltransferase